MKQRKISILTIIWAVFALCQLPAVCFAGLADYPTLAILPFDKKASVSSEITLKDVTIANEIVYDELVNYEIQRLLVMDFSIQCQEPLLCCYLEVFCFDIF